MIEDEAKTKWCPFVRVALMRTDGNDEQQPVSPAYNRMHFDSLPGVPSDGSERETLCIGSACMAWRWARERNPDWQPRHPMMATTGYEVHPDDQPKAYRASATEGFCGLSGAQQ